MTAINLNDYKEKRTLEVIMHNTLEGAKKLMDDLGTIPFSVGLFGGGKCMVMPLPPSLHPSNSSQKEIVAECIAELVEKHSDKDLIDGVLIMYEAWVCSVDIDSIKGSIPLPSEQPDRKECILISAKLKSGSKAGMCQFFTKQDDEVTYGKRLDTTNFEEMQNVFLDRVFTEGNNNVKH